MSATSVEASFVVSRVGARASACHFPHGCCHLIIITPCVMARMATIPLICSSLSATDLSLPRSQTGCHLLNPTHNTSVVSASYSAEQVRRKMGRSATEGKFTGEWQHEVSGQDTIPGLNQNILKLALNVRVFSNVIAFLLEEIEILKKKNPVCF